MRLIDTHHLGHDRVIGAWLHGELLIDPGPASCESALLEGLGDVVPRAIVLTHIHLDHAGATGVLVRRWPHLRVYVHERGAPHVIDPSRLIASASRLYGDEAEMARMWGEIAPVPAENVHALGGGERIEGLDVLYTPGHALHHVCYFDESSGDAFVGDMAGVRIPPAELTAMPTPPPEADVEAWTSSLALIAERGPRALRLTHFGVVESAAEHLELCAELLERDLELVRSGAERFLAAAEAEVGALDAEAAARYRHACPADHRLAGLERYLTATSRS